MIQHTYAHKHTHARTHARTGHYTEWWCESTYLFHTDDNNVQGSRSVRRIICQGFEKFNGHVLCACIGIRRFHHLFRRGLPTFSQHKCKEPNVRLLRSPTLNHCDAHHNEPAMGSLLTPHVVTPILMERCILRHYETCTRLAYQVLQAGTEGRH